MDWYRKFWGEFAKPEPERADWEGLNCRPIYGHDLRPMLYDLNRRLKALEATK